MTRRTTTFTTAPHATALFVSFARLASPRCLKRHAGPYVLVRRQSRKRQRRALPTTHLSLLLHPALTSPASPIRFSVSLTQPRQSRDRFASQERQSEGGTGRVGGETSVVAADSLFIHHGARNKPSLAAAIGVALARPRRPELHRPARCRSRLVDDKARKRGRERKQQESGRQKL